MRPFINSLFHELSAQTWAIARHVCAYHGCVSVCLCVDHDCVPCKIAELIEIQF